MSIWECIDKSPIIAFFICVVIGVTVTSVIESLFVNRMKAKAKYEEAKQNNKGSK